jgi:hypothetical protein
VVNSKLVDLSNATHREYLIRMECKGQTILRNRLDYLSGGVASKINRNDLCKPDSV